MNGYKSLNERNKGVELTVISKQIFPFLKPDHIVNEAFPFPFVLIDQQFLWLGIPMEGSRFVQPPYVSVRLDSRIICEYFFHNCMNLLRKH